MEKYRQKYWENIDRIRAEKGLSLHQLAMRTGTIYNDLVQARSNGHLPRIERLKKFADALGCPPEELIKDIFD